MSNKLTERERELYNMFPFFDVDVPIKDIHAKLYGEDDEARTPQQRLGALISRINRKLQQSERIVPGRLKQTYRRERTAQ